MTQEELAKEFEQGSVLETNPTQMEGDLSFSRKAPVSTQDASPQDALAQEFAGGKDIAQAPTTVADATNQAVASTQPAPTPETQYGTGSLEALKYNLSKGGAGINAMLANIAQAGGMDPSFFRENQQYWQGTAKTAEEAKKQALGDGLLNTIITEGVNPINYIPLGRAGLMALKVGGVVGADTAAEIATKGDMSGANLQDVKDVATSAGIGALTGAVVGKGIDLLTKPSVAKTAEATAKQGTSKPYSPEEIISLGKKYNVDIMTSDVYKPQGYFGQLFQYTTERIPLTGTGKQRLDQYKQRVDAIQEVADGMMLGDSQTMAKNVMDGLTQKREKLITTMTTEKSKIYERISNNKVNTQPIIASIDDQITTLTNDSPSFNAEIINILNIAKEDILRDNSIQQIEKVRKNVGSMLKKENVGPTDSIEKVKKSLYGSVNETIGNHIKEFGNPLDYNKWKAANKKITGMIEELKVNGLKSSLSKGDLKPEEVNRLLFSSSPSEVDVLYRNLTKEGRANARGAIMGRVMDNLNAKKGDNEYISSQSFRTEMAKMQPQIDKFFSPQDKVVMNELIDVLKLTGRAEDANANVKTGYTLQPLLTFGGLAAASDFVTASGTMLSIGAIGRIMESPSVRNSLIKLNKMKDTASEPMKNAMRNSIIRSLNEQANRQAGNIGKASAVITTGRMDENRYKQKSLPKQGDFINYQGY